MRDEYGKGGSVLSPLLGKSHCNHQTLNGMRNVKHVEVTDEFTVNVSP